MAWSKEELGKLRSELPRGAAAELSQLCGLKPGSIRNILSGQAKNDEVILAAIDLAKAYQAKLAQGKKSIAVA